MMMFLENNAAALLVSVISPVLVLLVQHWFFTKDEKRTDLRITIMKDAARALASYQSDALNPALQAKPQTDGRTSRVTSMRDETTDALGETLATVRSCFSVATADLYDKAVRTKLSIETNPSPEFEANRRAAMKAMADEIGLR